jgi:hypothetical protein
MTQDGWEKTMAPSEPSDTHHAMGFHGFYWEFMEFYGT